MKNTKQICVTLPIVIAEKFDKFCKKNGYKKSTFISYLIKENIKNNNLT